MEDFISSIFIHSNQIVLLVTLLLLLAGLNVPISEDLVLIGCGAVVCDALPLTQLLFYSWLFLVCWISAWEAYALGRTLGPKLLNMRVFRGTLTSERVKRIQHFYHDYGFVALLVGRFIPFGVRNALFMTAGLSRMSFPRFIVSDLIPCLLSTALLFCLGVYFGKNSDLLYEYLVVYQRVIGVTLAIALTGGVGIWSSRQRATPRSNRGILSD